MADVERSWLLKLSSPLSLQRIVDVLRASRTCPISLHDEIQIALYSCHKVYYGGPSSLISLFSTVWLDLCLYFVLREHFVTCT